MATATKLTPAKAAEVWAEAKRTIQQAQPELEAAAKVLKEHFQRTGKAEYKGIGYSKTVRKQLDTEHVKTELYDRLDEFMKPVTYETLSLLD